MWIFLEEFLRKKTAELGQGVSRKVHRFSLDKIFHRVGCDELAVVTSRVGFPKRIPVDEHQNIRPENRSLGPLAGSMQTIHRNIALAVVIPLRSAGESVHCS